MGIPWITERHNKAQWKLAEGGKKLGCAEASAGDKKFMPARTAFLLIGTSRKNALIRISMGNIQVLLRYANVD